MILRRLGTKSKIVNNIIIYFPEHDIYIEPFFGAGGLFFNKPKVRYNILNDIDSDVFNLFMVLKKNKSNLEKAIIECPIHSDLLNHWKKNKETDPIQKALRFLFLSNYTLYGAMDTLRLNGNGKDKQILIENIFTTYKMIWDVKFTNFDFRKFIKAISLNIEELKRTFIYADPPYLETGSNYQNFNEKDSIDLFDCLENKGCKWAMSEFDNPFILKQAKKRNLNVIEIGERVNIRNRKTEILITNYEIKNKPLF